MGGEGGSSKKQVEYVVDTLLDIEDRLPPRGVFNNSKRWWQEWHCKVANAGKTCNFSELSKAALDIAFQMKDNVSTPWWKSQSSDWQKKVESARTSDVLVSGLSDLLTKAVDWAAARTLFASESSEIDNKSARVAVEGQEKSRRLVKAVHDVRESTVNRSGVEETRQKGMGKEKRESSKRVSEEGGVKKLTSCPAHLGRRSKRKLIAEAGVELSLAESPSCEPHDVNPTVGEGSPSTGKRRKEGKGKEGHPLNSNQCAGKTGPSETDLQEDQSSADVPKLKHYRRKGHSVESAEREQGNENAQEIEVDRKIEIGYSRVKRSKPSLESHQSNAGQTSETVLTGSGRKVACVPTEDVLGVEENTKLEEATTSVSSPLRRRGRPAGAKIGLGVVKGSKSPRKAKCDQTHENQIAKDGPLQLELESGVQIKRKRGRPKKIRPPEIAVDGKLGSENGGGGKDKNGICMGISSAIGPQIPKADAEIISKDVPDLTKEHLIGVQLEEATISVSSPVRRPGRQPGLKSELEVVESSKSSRVAKCGQTQENQVAKDGPVQVEQESVVQIKRKRGRPKKIKPVETADVKLGSEDGGESKDKIENLLGVISAIVPQISNVDVEMATKDDLPNLSMENLVDVPAQDSNGVQQVLSSDYSPTEDSEEYQLDDDAENQEFMDGEDSWGKRLPSESSDFEEDIPSSPSTLKTSGRGQVESSLEQSSMSQDLTFGDEICSMCDFAGADELMLLCDEAGCTCAAHTFCLNPPLEAIPEGEWLCPHCAYQKANPTNTKRRTKKCSGERDPRKVISSIIGRRIQPLQEEGKSSGTTKMQYLVKWDSLSHEHDSWIPEDWLLFMENRLVMTFQRKHPVSLETANDNLDERRPEWVRIDRIIGCRRQHGKFAVHPSHVSTILRSREQDKTRVEFLVKWQGLEHTSATWEEESVTDEMQKAISDYGKRHERAKECSEKEEEVKPVAAIKLQPDYLVGGVMYSFQLHGLKWLLSNFEQGRSVILADEMGLGKTIQSIAFLSCVRYEKLSSRPALVIAPKSTLPGWEQEFRRWAPSLNMVVYNGDKENRALIRDYEFYAASRKPLFEVLVTSYELATFDNSLLSKFHWASLIVDEGHRVKNVRSKLGGLLKRHKADFRLLLTGTPVQNTLTELFALLHFLDPVEFPNPENSARQFTEVDVKGVNRPTDANVIEQQVSRLHELLNPRMLRRLKSEVLSDMIPGKRLVEVSCALTPFQRHLYSAILKKNFKVLNKGVKSGLKRSLNTVLTDLKMVCNHPYLFPDKEPYQLEPQEAYKMLVAASGKLQLLEKLLPLLKEGGHRVLLFSQMTKMLDILEDFMGFLGLRYTRIDGSTSASIRQENIAEFNTATSSTFIFLISTRAGGLGINLPSADTVIIYDPDFNPFVDIQAQARAHRIGQEKTVLVYQLITKCSVEEKILQRSRKKLAMENLVMSKESGETAKDINTLLLHGAQKILDEHDFEATSIKFTDESVKKLLDREISTSAINNDEAQTHGYLGAVQGADFMSPTSEEQEQRDSKGGDGTEWQVLLQNVVDFDVKEELGRGKRVRKQVMYAVEGHVEGQEDDEYDPTSDGENSSGSDLSLDSEGVHVKQGRKIMNPVRGGVPVAQFPSMQEVSGPFSYNGGTSGLTLPGASVSVSPLPPNSPHVASSILPARGISPSWMRPSTNMGVPVMSAGTTSFGMVNSTPPALVETLGGPGFSDAIGFNAKVVLSGTSGRATGSHLGSVPSNPVLGGKSGNTSAEVAGVPSTIDLSGAGPSGTGFQNSPRPFTGLYPHTNSFGQNTNINPYMASPFPGIPSPYYPFNAQFSSQPFFSPFPFVDGRVDSVNVNTMRNSDCAAFSNLQQAMRGWKTSDKTNMTTPPVSGGNSRAKGNPGPIGGHQLSKTAPSNLQSTPSTVQSGTVSSHYSVSKPAKTKRVSTSSRLPTTPAAPWLAGYCSVPSFPLPCQADPNMTGVSLLTPPVTGTAVPVMPDIPTVSSAYPVSDFHDPTKLQYPPAFTDFGSSTHFSISGGDHETLCNSKAEVANSISSPVMPEDMVVRPCPPTLEFVSAHEDPVKLAPVLDETGSSCAVSLETSGTFSQSTLPSHESAEDLTCAPSHSTKWSRKSRLSTLPTSEAPESSISTKELGVPVTEAGAGSEDRVSMGGDLSSSVNRNWTGQSQPSSVSFGERVGNEVGSSNLPEQKFEQSRLASSSKPLLHSRKPLWVPKGDAGLLMGHLQDHGGMGSGILKFEEGSSPDNLLHRSTSFHIRQMK